MNSLVGYTGFVGSNIAEKGIDIYTKGIFIQNEPILLKGNSPPDEPIICLLKKSKNPPGKIYSSNSCIQYIIVCNHMKYKYLSFIYKDIRIKQ